MKILFFAPYPVKESPSQRFRFEQYFTLLEHQGIGITVQSFLSQNNWRIFYQRGQTLRKGWALLTGFCKRIISLFKAAGYDYVFIHREMAPIGPPIFEWIIAKVLRKKTIYDFDDAIWLTDRSNENVFRRVMKWRSKVNAICRWSYRVSCGNQFLQQYALQFNPRSIINPTTVDTDLQHNGSLHSKSASDKIVVGWTGSHSTLKYLKEIEDVLSHIEQEHKNVEILIIADQDSDLELQSKRFVPWTEQSEVQDLLQVDIGIMPLPNDEWSKGKCGFKAIQYLSLEIPALVSDVGVNSTVVEHGKSGFVCKTKQDWTDSLRLLICNESLRREMGRRGRARIIQRYSLASNSSNFLSLFE